jgi:hypothetical protein
MSRFLRLWQAAQRNRWHVLAVSQVAAFMALLDVSIVNVTLPSIERGLGASCACGLMLLSLMIAIG